MAVRTKWTYEKLASEALKYASRKDFERGNPRAYNAAMAKGLIDDICAHIPSRLKTWDEKTLSNEALKYNTRSEFQKANSSAYTMAWRKGLLDKVCAHMAVKKRNWTIGDLIVEAMSYSTRNEFYHNSGAAYAYAHKNGYLDFICDHMERRNSDYDCFYVIFDTVEFEEGVTLAKFGVTSSRLGTLRLDKHCRTHFVEPVRSALFRFKNALSIESHFLKKYQDRPPFTKKIDGYTELRLLPTNMLKSVSNEALSLWRLEHGF